MTLIHSTNPSIGHAVIGSIESSTTEEVQEAVASARWAYRAWSHTPISERVSLLREVYDGVVANKEILAQSVATEMGMPIRYARDDVGIGLIYFAWYLDHAEETLAPTVTYEDDNQIHTVTYEPKWVIAAITPWNYPVMLWIWACIQPLLAGNTVVWKISKEVILTGKIIADIIAKTSLPPWVWSEIYGDGSIWDLLTDMDIDGITFTGSTNVGNHLREKAMKKNITAVMELGGSAPGIVCADADIDSVIETIYFMRFSNSGQICDGLKRLIVHESRYDEVVTRLRETLMQKKIGNATDEDTDIWPLATESQLHTVSEQYDDALAHDANILVELPIPAWLSGSYFPAVVLGNITPDMKVWKEEVFGPILPIVTYSTEDEVITLANDTIYGLGAYIFTESETTFGTIAQEIKTGMVQMNNVNYCIPANPFGGYGASGVGREHGKWWFHELVNIKVTSRPKVKR
jgi:succinate-semialdehyde dehydrogenase/glutarate-semialdehyde dehydrogenase